jgi:hypothetical protein
MAGLLVKPCGSIQLPAAIDFDQPAAGRDGGAKEQA